MKYHDVMLDLETLSHRPNAAVISIGAVCFEPLGVELGPEFKRNVMMDEIDRLGHVSGSTVEWWFGQTEAARAKLQTPGPIRLRRALREFNEWLWENTDGIRMWGNGSTFDNVVIRAAYEAVGQAQAWQFRDDLCYRTLVRVFDSERKLLEREGEHHDSLADARSQARHLQKILRRLLIPIEQRREG